ncbi:hypothetical protein D8674_029570 [Pyrus ussuriensis x Pyrus communis]|uniref:Uncharacterized protein n=1 Tax=Pyrus ussuriensis x Pyrus communis TaxID=2448454 RepID=A0A5N5I2G7_9ROSA|nr:hypothetical protein D8674_029570 [Pyrus ussuriensis x Pyrus communis]
MVTNSLEFESQFPSFRGRRKWGEKKMIGKMKHERQLSLVKSTYSIVEMGGMGETTLESCPLIKQEYVTEENV